MSSYLLTWRAQKDLELIWNYIAADNIDAADKVKDELRSAMQGIAAMPGKGHGRADVRNRRYRFWAVYSYIIAYFPDTEPVRIISSVGQELIGIEQRPAEGGQAVATDDGDGIFTFLQ